MTSATRKALVETYGILIRAGWGNEDDATDSTPLAPRADSQPAISRGGPTRVVDGSSVRASGVPKFLSGGGAST